MKKTTLLKTLFLLCALVVGSMNGWAVSKPWSGDDPTSTLDLKTITSSSMGTWYAGSEGTAWYLGDDYLVVSGYESYKSVANQTWITQASVGSSNNTWDAVENEPFKGSSYYTNASYATIQTGRYLLYKVTNLKSLKVYGKNNATSKYLDIFIYTKQGDNNYTLVEEITYTTDNSEHIWNSTETLSSTETYYIYITGKKTGSGSDSNSRVFEVAFERNTSTEPYVSANNVSIYGDDTSGTISYSLGNPVEGGVVSAAEKTDVDWLSDVAVDGTNNKVTFTTTENASSERTATITITYTYDSGNKTATKDVTVTQKKHVDYMAVYEKATAETMVLGGSYIWYGEKLNTGAYLAKGLGSETYLGAVALGSDSRVRDNELSLTNESGVQTFTFVPLDTYGEWNIMLGSNKLGIDGDRKLYLDKGDVSWTMGGTGSNLPSFSATYNKTDYTMYANIGSTRFNAYTSKGSMDDAILYHLATESNHTLTLDPNDGGSSATYHVKDGFSFVPFAPTRDGYTFLGWATSASAATPTVAEGASYTMPAANITLYAVWGVSVTLGTNGYATFASSNALDLTALPTGLSAYKAAVSGSNVNFTELDQKVPGNTGMLLKGDNNGEYNIPVAATSTTVVDNAFQVNTSGTTFAAEDGFSYFGLKKNTLTFGLFDPTSVVIPASKAYLKVLTSTLSSHELTVTFDGEQGDVTGIAEVSSQKTFDGEYYNLAGQRVDQPTKGLYIVNGKKVIIK